MCFTLIVHCGGGIAYYNIVLYNYLPLFQNIINSSIRCKCVVTLYRGVPHMLCVATINLKKIQKLMIIILQYVAKCILLLRNSARHSGIILLIAAIKHCRSHSKISADSCAQENPDRSMTALVESGSLHARSIGSESLHARSIGSGSLHARSIGSGSLHARSIESGSLHARSIGSGSLHARSIGSGSLHTRRRTQQVNSCFHRAVVQEASTPTQHLYTHD